MIRTINKIKEKIGSYRLSRELQSELVGYKISPHYSLEETKYEVILIFQRIRDPSNRTYLRTAIHFASEFDDYEAARDYGNRCLENGNVIKLNIEKGR